MRKQAGFSLVELMLGVGILASCIVMLALLLTSALRSAQRGVDYAAGAAVAELVLEKYLKDNPTPIVTALAEEGNWNLNRATFNYQIQVESVDADLVKVKVLVTWGGATGGGQPFELVHSRLIYINKSPLT